MTRDVRSWMPWLTLVVDVILINVAFLIAYWLRYDLQLFRSVDPANNVPYYRLPAHGCAADRVAGHLQPARRRV